MDIKVRFGSGLSKDGTRPPRAGEKVRHGLDTTKNGSLVMESKSRAREGEAAGKTGLDPLKEMENLVGLGEIKRLVKELQAYAEVQRLRARENLVNEPLVLHMIFKGNPGTGKTTVARILGKVFKDAGLLSKGHLVEVERADLVGEYIGHTASKTREQVKKALGGILFIDEAYSLARGGEKDFGREAIDHMVKAMEDHRHELILILAGYKDEMNWFLQSNPGLRSRFPLQMDFLDYSVEELVRIALLMIKERDYVLSPDAIEKLERVARRHVTRGHRFDGNARMVRNIIERAIRRQAVRVVALRHPDRLDLSMITAADLLEEGGEEGQDQVSKVTQVVRLGTGEG